MGELGRRGCFPRVCTVPGTVSYAGGSLIPLGDDRDSVDEDTDGDEE